MSETFDPVVIIGAARTPIGAMLGELKSVSAPGLGVAAIRAAVARADAPTDQIDDVLMGCVLSAGLGQAPARQASLAAGLPEAAGCVTINKMCGSGMKAIQLAHDQLLAGSSHAIVAGGMESMSNAPYLLERAREGYRMGHKRLLDHMFLDGLEDAYDKGRLMGDFAEDCATTHQFTRQMQDDYATLSLERARRAAQQGDFDWEIAPLETQGRDSTTIARDELPAKAKIEAIAKLKPAFRDGGTVTAANSSAISDGAAALTLMRRDRAERAGLTPLAIIRAHATHAGPPNLFPTAPISAMRKLAERLGWPLSSVDLFEINEAFAVVVMAAMRELDLPRDRVNVHGGACALGHPIGASGARIVVTLLAALRKYGLRRGVAALCIGGGEAAAVAIETVN
ncbi:acetyl-CoA acetyltransferase [Methylosinus sp. R-45379]|uniref:acetyl-CoA C-acyltransferase n=1 Tax=Methylosinus sp. R-45379 TaxID=980563 RepID=UPI0007C8B7B2|nr:acetyl-CoA C-acyltransferase [Methylosinus sp. R-45379]OAI30750.1 acetyl-CoA acetyltransferase [Methylosinus sp. R-45379]